MKLKPSSSILILASLVLTVYVLRHSDMSLSQTMRKSFRILADSKPSQSICSGINLDHPFSAAEVKQSSQLRKGLRQLRKGNQIEKIFVDSGSSGSAKDYGMTLIPAVAVWGVFLIGTVILCCVNCCNWCCIYGCCKSCSCCACCKQPKNTDKNKKYILMSVFVLTATLAASIAGIVLSNKIAESMRITYCSFLGLAEDTEYGRPQDMWMGIKGAVTNLDNLINKFDTATNNMNDISSQFTILDTKKSDCDTKVSYLYSNNNARTVTRADPNKTPTTYKPKYIDNLGPKTQDGTYTNLIQKEIDLQYNTMSDAGKKINDATKAIQSKKADIKNALKSGKDIAQSISDSLGSFLDLLSGTGASANSGFKKGGSGVAGLFGVYLFLAFFSLAAMLMVVRFKVRFCNKILHLCWCVIGLITIISWIFVIILYPVSIATSETCEVALNSVNDRALLTNALQNIGQDDVSDVLNTCLFGDGNILGQFKVADQLDLFDDVFTNMDALSQVFNIDSSTAPVSATIKAQKDLFTSLAAFTTSDSDTTTQDLSSLNKITNVANNPCTNLQDTWTLHSNDCPTSGTTVFMNANADAYNKPNPTCLGFNQWLPSHTSSGRYASSNFPSCSAPNDLATATSFVTKFTTNRNDIINMFGSSSTTTKTDLYSVDTTYTAFANQLLVILNKFKTIKSDLAGVKDSLVGQDYGLIPNSNCKFVAIGLRNTVNAACVGFVTRVFESTIVLIIVSVMMTISTFSIFCLAKRLNLPTPIGKPFTPY